MQYTTQNTSADLIEVIIQNIVSLANAKL